MDEGGIIREVCETFFFLCETFKRTISSSPLESHDSHLSVVALDCCKEDGVTVLSFPPHFSHKLQPLYRSVCRACEAWITNHTGKTMTIYDFPALINMSLSFRATPANIKA
jgi:hypothetical protein